MAGKPPDKPKSGKPFLAEDDLLSELDAWDATFDALHGGPEAQQAAANEPPMAWPEPPEAQDTQVVPPSKTQLDAIPQVRTDNFNRLSSEDGTLEAALDGHDGADTFDTFDRDPHEPAGAAPTLDIDPMETDFSELGTEGRPETLGEMLGPRREDDDAATIDVDRTRISHHRATTPPPMDDGDVFTSASRPTRAPENPAAPYDDPIAPPPVASPPKPRTTEAMGRVGPAIVRRVTAPQAAINQDNTPARGMQAAQFAEQTRVINTEEIEAQAQASKRSMPVIPVDDDAYDDIEIDSKDESLPGEVDAEPAAHVRRTAHVVRRAEAPTRPPPVGAPRPGSGPIIEMEVGTPVPPRAPSVADAEDDFSDVAAAVGAEAALGIEEEVDFGLDDEPIVRRTPPPPPRKTPPPLRAVTPIPDDEPDVESEEDAPLKTMIAGPTYDELRRSSGQIPAVDADEPQKTMIASPSYDDLQKSQRPPALVDLYPRVKTPTSVPPLGILDELEREDAGARRAPARIATPVAEPSNEVEPVLDLDTVARGWPEQVAPLPSTELDESCAQALLVYEREVATLDDSASTAALRIEAGRLCEKLADLERARIHYDTALIADPRATAALRGLRRIARASGDLAEVTRHLDTEIAVAGALERRPLGHYRIDLLMATGEQDLARVAVGEILDTAPSDIRALLAHLELAFVDGRADEFGTGLEQIANAVTDNELRAAVQSARGVLAAHHNDTAGAATWFTAAAESDPNAIAGRLGAVRHAAAQADGAAAARALIEVARQTETGDPLTSAAAAIRAAQWAPAGDPSGGDPSGSALAAEAAALATMAAASDPLVARLAAEAARDANSFALWAHAATAPTERAYAAARAAELDPARAAELWAIALAQDPDDDYGAAQLRTAHVAAEATQAAIDVDLAIANDPERERARLRAAFGMIALGQLDAAIDALVQGRSARPSSLALTEALGEALAAAGRWTERAELFAELAGSPGEQLDGDVARLRSAIAWEEAVGAAAADPSDGGVNDQLQRLTASALEACERVLEQHRHDPAAHATAILLATRLGDRDVLGEVLTRAQAAERTATPTGALAAASLAFRRARLVADDSQRAETILRDVAPPDEPRRTVALTMAAVRGKELGDAAAALEERANNLDGRPTEVAVLRLRAAQIALDVGDAAKATRLLQQVEQALPSVGVVSDLLAAARRRAGDRPTVAQARRTEPVGASKDDAFVRIVRDGDLALVHGDRAAALGFYQRALELKPNDPLAAVPLARVATELRDPAPLTALALAELRAAESIDDGPAKAAAYERIALIDAELRNDEGAAQIALESASQADPTRIDLLHRLERGYARVDELAELQRLRTAEIALVAEGSHDRAALLLDLAGLADRDNKPEVELAEIYRATLAANPRVRLALLHLESSVRRSGASEELAQLEEKIAEFFEGDPKTQAAFWTRSGETLAELGKIDEAVQRFGRADATLQGHIPALEGWRQAALKGALWIDVAEAAQRQAIATSDEALRAAHHHFAGVALMDKALVAEQAMLSFRRALDADPRHRDAFLRLRILLEEDANHDDLATLLANRLEVEDEVKLKIELHRALAELHRNFLSDRETATQHYRAILDYDPNDLRSHAAIADIAWETGNWQDAADALMARARLEREPEILKTLCFRLGLIYADRLVDVPMALKAFQRALTYQPDDENVLVRLADLAAQIGEWKLALGACERLVKNESDPDRRAVHLHRVAKIFKDGFGDTKRAERALNLALDSSPMNDDALDQLVAFYRDTRDITSLRVHLNRVAGTMRQRIAQNPTDGGAYRVIARAMQARANTNAPGSLPIARAAAQLADLLGAATEAEKKLVELDVRTDPAVLLRPETDDVVFPRSIQTELRQVFQLLGDRIAKHVGVNVQAYGVSRGDRLRAKDNAVAAVAQSVATQLGFGEIDVYVSARQPWVMVAEPTSPVSLVIGQGIAGAGGDAIRFAAGAALKLAQSSLAIPARMQVDELGVLVVALLRLFQPDFPAGKVDQDAIAAQFQKLRRLIPTNLMNELKPYALAIDTRLDPRELARDLRLAQLRAGLAASGSLLAGLRILAAQADAELPGFLADPVAQGLVSFALSEDHAVIAR